MRLPAHLGDIVLYLLILLAAAVVASDARDTGANRPDAVNLREPAFNTDQ